MLRWNVDDGIGSDSCPVKGFGIRSVEASVVLTPC
jgi:hypothetical protein